MTKHQYGTVRIIGGQWRRRLLTVPTVPGLRPTHDRIRETLFNWLMPYISGARCLDLFAGSGVLGFEALSRGAQFVSFVDNDPRVIEQLKLTAGQLNVPLSCLEIVSGNCIENKLILSTIPYDIVFIDPPYRANLLPLVVQKLEAGNFIKSSSLIYMEMEKEIDPFSFLKWKLLREGGTSSLRYYLFKRE